MQGSEDTLEGISSENKTTHTKKNTGNKQRKLKCQIATHIKNSVLPRQSSTTSHTEGIFTLVRVTYIMPGLPT